MYRSSNTVTVQVRIPRATWEHIEEYCRLKRRHQETFVAELITKKFAQVLRAQSAKTVREIKTPPPKQKPLIVVGGKKKKKPAKKKHKKSWLGGLLYWD